MYFVYHIDKFIDIYIGTIIDIKILGAYNINK